MLITYHLPQRMATIFTNGCLHLLMTTDTEGTRHLLSMIINLITNEFLVREVFLAHKTHKVTLYNQNNLYADYHVVHLT